MHPGTPGTIRRDGRSALVLERRREFFPARRGGTWPLSPEGEPASLAFASYIDRQRLEIGVETQPAWRGQGYAPAACRGILRHCREHGLEPLWSCRTENVGSYRLALKVGFTPLYTTPYYEVASSKDVS